MASFCNRCGAPVSGIFCVKCSFVDQHFPGNLQAQEPVTRTLLLRQVFL